MRNYKTKNLLGNNKISLLVQRGYRFDGFINGFVSYPINSYRVVLVKMPSGIYELNFMLLNGMLFRPTDIEVYTDKNGKETLEAEVKWLRDNNIFK